MLFLILIGPLTLSAQTDFHDIREAAKERITKTMKKKKVVGMAIAVVSSRGTLWTDHFGYEDEANQQLVTEETLFGLGSVTKVFTSTAVLQLAEENKIKLDNPLDQYLPSLHMKGGNEGVTPRNVLTHHSGLPSDIFKGMFSHQPEDYKSVVSYMNQEYMAGTPDQIRAYSNPGYTLLGHMVAEVSGMEYPEYMQEHILDPLAMNRTRFNAVEGASKTYDTKGKPAQDVNLRDIPAGGLFSTSADMAAFLRSVLRQSPDLLQKETFHQMLEQQHDGAPLNFSNRYALGWSMTSRPHAGDLYTHTGTTLYYNSAIAFSPKADVGVIIMTNSGAGGNLFAEANTIIEQIAKRKGLSKTHERASVDLGSKRRVTKSASVLDEYAGTYAAPGAYIDVYCRRNKLFMKLQGLRLELIPVESDQFIPKVILLHTIPIRLGEQRVMFKNMEGHFLMTSIEAGSPEELIAVKVEPQPIPAEWSDRTGDYETINALPGELPFFEDFRITQKDSLLVLSFKTISDDQRLDMVLKVINENRANIAGLGRYGGQSVTCEDGIIKVFGIQLTKRHE